MWLENHWIGVVNLGVLIYLAVTLARRNKRLERNEHTLKALGDLMISLYPEDGPPESRSTRKAQAIDIWTRRPTG